MSRVGLPLIAFALLVGCAEIQAGPSNPFDGLTAADRELARATRQTALETGARGEVFVWAGSGPETGGSVTVLATLRRANGTYCRRFQEAVHGHEASDSFEAVFCRNGDGSWSP